MAISLMFRHLSIRAKLVAAFIVMMLASMTTSLYYSSQVKALADFNARNLQAYYSVNELSTAFETIRKQLDIYVNTKNPQAYTEYSQSRYKSADIIARLLQGNKSTNETYGVRSINNMTKFMIKDCNLLFWQINAGDPEYYITYFEALTKLDYLSTYLSDYLNLLLTESSADQQHMAERVNRSDTLNIIFLAFSAFCCVMMTIGFSEYFTRPITALAHAAQKISHGDFNVPDLPVESNDEMGNLTESFNVMKASVESSIVHLNQRAELEARLHQKELENVKMSQLLNQAQYLALQNQINPHFLFNTLNAIARAAVRDTPKTTTTLIYSLADLFRYNLDHTNKFSTLGEELNIVEKYIYIQKHRFRERINYKTTGDSCDSALVPSMLLQPLVENSIIHGIEELESGGMIITNVRKIGDKLILRVFDNGKGISRERLRDIMSGKSVRTGHSTGIGLTNIIQRVELIPNANMRMYSGRMGTLVKLTLPYSEKQEDEQ